MGGYDATFYAITRYVELPLAAIFAVWFCTQWLTASRHSPGQARRLPFDFCHRLGQRPGRAILLVGLLSFTLSLLLGLVHHPVPVVHDEFSYLLAGDTFAHGRLTNPPHELWKHFESFHILQQPTYASKYPPGQGLFLALGQRLSGQPIVGVWLSLALASSATCWMLFAYLPPRWATLGGLLTALHPHLLIQWGHTYWGGAVAMLGGALLLGGLARVMTCPRVRDSLAMGLGIITLANTRPLEGLITCLPCAAILAHHLYQLVSTKPTLCKGWASTRFPLAALTRIIAPAMGLLALGGLAMTHYNRVVTGQPFRLPYQVHEETYDSIPLFLFQQEGPERSYRHRVMQDFHRDWYREVFTTSRADLPQLVATRISTLWSFLVGTWFSWPLLALPAMWRRRGTALALSIALLVTLTLQTTVWLHPHYAAPIVPSLMLLVLQGLRTCWLLPGPTQGARQTLVCWVPRLMLLSCGLSCLLALYLSRGDYWFTQKARLEQQLISNGGQHLVLVEYTPQHNKHVEWVANKADFATTPVLWARSMTPEHDQQLLATFPHRTPWRLRADTTNPQLERIRKPASAK